MPLLDTRPRVVKLPFGSVEVDWGHPLARKLVHYWPTNEGGGNQTNLTSPPWPAKLQSANLAVWSTDAKGLTMKFSGAQFNAVGVIPSLVTSPVSIFAGVVLVNNVGTQIIASWGDAAGASADLGMTPTRGGGGLFKVEWNGTILTGTLANILNRPSVVGWTRAGSTGSWTATIYQNGILDTRGTTATNPVTAGTFALGRPGDFNGAYFNGQIEWLGVWSRALSASEALWLAKEPYAFLRPRPAARTAFMQGSQVAAAAPVLPWRTLIGVGAGLRVAHLIARNIPVSRRDFFNSWIVKP